MQRHEQDKKQKASMRASETSLQRHEQYCAEGSALCALVVTVFYGYKNFKTQISLVLSLVSSFLFQLLFSFFFCICWCIHNFFTNGRTSAVSKVLSDGHNTSECAPWAMLIIVT